MLHTAIRRILNSVDSVLGVPDGTLLAKIRAFKMVNISKQDVGTSFKSAHTACQSSNFRSIL